MLTKEVVVNLIANTKTKKGLTVTAVLDENDYNIIEILLLGRERL